MVARFQDKSEKDLFDQFQVGGKKIRKKTRILLPQLKKSLSLSYENAIFLIIGFTMACIICFSLGVEKGRQDAGITENPVPVAPLRYEAGTRNHSLRSGTGQANEIQNKYVIQLAAFRKKGPAEDALAKLRSEGYIANIKRSGDYYQIFIGGFEKRREAEGLLKRLKGKYKDCYIKKYK